MCLSLQLEKMSKECGTYIEVDISEQWYKAVSQLTVDYEDVKKRYIEALDPLKYDGAELVVSLFLSPMGESNGA